MTGRIQNIDNYLLHNYTNSSFVIMQKARLLYIYFSIGIIILPAHFIYMYFFANVDLMQLVGSIPTFFIIILSLIILINGKYDVAANIGLSTILVLMGYATVQNINHSPMNVISMNLYILMFVIVQAALFNRTVWLCGTAAVIIALDIFAYFSINKSITDAELTYYTTGLMSSLISIIMTFVLSLLYKKIAQFAILRSESESEINKKQYGQIKELLISVYTTSDKLADHSDLLSNNANSFLEGSQNQAATIEEISSASEEVMSGVEQVFQVVHEQQQSLIRLLQKIVELFSITSEIGDQIITVSRSTEEITDMAQKGNIALGQMQSGMKRITESANAMKNIVSMINDIADKINLLSLNASIEAARAGVSGRGFAVVADEISRLGIMTQSSMSEIDKLIQSASGDLDAGLNSVDITVKTMSEIINAINRIVKEISTISEKSKNQNEINLAVNSESESLRIKSDQIKDMMSMQQIALDEIVKSITSINEITQIYVNGSRRLYSDAEIVGKLAEALKRDVNVQ